MKKIITMLLSVLLIAGLFTSCDGNALEKVMGSGDIPAPVPKPAETVEVEFNANGGTGTMDVQIFAKGVSAALNKCSLTAPAGKVFGGWMLNSSGSSADYADEASYPANESKTLYALWETDYLCFTSMEAGSTVVLGKNGNPADVSFQYSSDKTTWNDYTIGEDISLANVGDKVYFKKTGTGVISSFSADYDNSYSFSVTGDIEAGGNVMSLLDPSCELTDISASGYEYCFIRLFEGCSGLKTAPKLPATKLNSHCYEMMFADCSSLLSAPVLPAVNLADNCYNNMFYQCSLLTEVPALPAVDLAESCYFSMFYACTSLTEAPVLPAANLVDYCYYCMFYDCTNLSNVTMLATDVSATECLGFWLSNVATTGTLKVDSTMTVTLGPGNYDVPAGWTVQPF